MSVPRATVVFMTTYRWCAECGDERAFDQPPCLDGHAGECPEWCCVECGAAVVIGGLVPEVLLVEVNPAA